MLCVCVGDVIDVVFSVCIVRRGAGRYLCMGSVSVSSCRCCMFVSCVDPVAVLNAAFCTNFSLLMLVKDGRGILQYQSHELFCLDFVCDCFVLSRQKLVYVWLYVGEGGVSWRTG